jgi:hypothetical protein
MTTSAKEKKEKTKKKKKKERKKEKKKYYLFLSPHSFSLPSHFTLFPSSGSLGFI